MKKKVSGKSLTLEKFIDITKKDLEKKIIDMVSDKHVLSILEGGKRLRSLLAQLSFKTCTQGKESTLEYQKALEGSVVIELAHAASLLHDDIIDNDKERRGKTSFHVKTGVANAILTGHKMLVTGFNIALRHGEEWAKLYVNSWDDVVNGEIDEVELNINGFKSKDIDSKSEIFEKYHKIIDMKTAALFSSVCKAGAIEANMNREIIDIFSDYGREIGLAYQLADDLVDLEQGELIESVIVPLLNRIGDKEKIKNLKKRELKKKFIKNKDKIKEFFISEITDHINKAEDIAKNNLIPNSEYKEILGLLPRYIINEMLKEIKLNI